MSNKSRPPAKRRTEAIISGDRWTAVVTKKGHARAYQIDLNSGEILASFGESTILHNVAKWRLVAELLDRAKTKKVEPEPDAAEVE